METGMLPSESTLNATRVKTWKMKTKIATLKVKIHHKQGAVLKHLFEGFQEIGSDVLPNFRAEF